MNDIVNNVLKEKLDELEQVKFNFDLKINELSVNAINEGEDFVIEDQIRSQIIKYSIDII